MAARLPIDRNLAPQGASTDVRRQRFTAVAAQVYEPVQRYLRRRADATLADDVLADTLAVVWRRLDDVPDDALPWCYGVARRCLANARRSTRRQDRLAARLAAEPAQRADATEPAGTPVDDELHHALVTLSDADRELVHLWAWEGLEPREIAVVLDTTANAVSIRLHRLRRRLADQLRPIVTRKDPHAAGHPGSTRHEREEDR